MKYRIDFHVHSKYSDDCVSDLKRILEVAKSRGLAGIAITDHGTIMGAVRMSQLNEDGFFKIIAGSEIATECGDIIGLFLDKEIRSKKCFEVMSEIRSQDGIVVLPHPFKRTQEINMELVSNVDAVEVLNSRLKPEQNQRALKLARMFGKPILGGSDAHLVSEVGKGYTMFDDISNMKERILRGSCEVGGTISPKYVHYFSSFIGNYNKRTLIKAILKKAFL